METITSQRKGKLVVVNNYQFRTKGKNKKTGTEYFACIHNECKSRVTVYADGSHTEPGDHAYHDDDFVLNSQKKFRAHLRSQVAKTPNAPLKPLYDQVANNLQARAMTSPEAVQIVGQFTSYVNTMNRVRSAARPPLPSSRSQINLQGIWTQTKGENPRSFLMIDEGQEDKLLVFATLESLQILSESEKLFMDGTFYTSPPLFQQIYTIHGYFKGQVMPLVYALLPNKTHETYKRLLTGIKNKINEMGKELNVEVVQTDFEAAAIKAAKLYFATVKGCFFHFTKAIFAKACDIGLKGIYSDRYLQPNLVRIIVKRCMAIALLNPELVTEAWDGIMLLALDIPEDNACRPLVQEFLVYMARTWIGVEGITPLFRKDLWNQSNNFRDRTNNSVEGWHSGFNHGSAHPNIYRLVEKLQEEEAKQAREIRRLRNGGNPKVSGKNKYKVINDHLHNLSGQLDSGMINCHEFLDRTSAFLHV